MKITSYAIDTQEHYTGPTLLLTNGVRPGWMPCQSLGTLSSGAIPQMVAIGQ